MPALRATPATPALRAQHACLATLAFAVLRAPEARRPRQPPPPFGPRPLVSWGAGCVPGERVSTSAVAASAGGDAILIGADVNDSGAFAVVASNNPLGVGIFTLRAVGDMGSTATAPLVIVEEK